MPERDVCPLTDEGSSLGATEQRWLSLHAKKIYVDELLDKNGNPLDVGGGGGEFWTWFHLGKA